MAYNRDLDNGRKICARLDDPKVRDIVNSWIDEIVYGLISVIHIFNPSCIVSVSYTHLQIQFVKQTSLS